MARPRSGRGAPPDRSREGGPSRFEDPGGIEGLLDASHQEIAVRSRRPCRKTRAKMLDPPLYPSGAADHSRSEQERLRVADHSIVIADEMCAGDPARHVRDER